MSLWQDIRGKCIHTNCSMLETRLASSDLARLVEETISGQTSFASWLASCFTVGTCPWIPQIMREVWVYTGNVKADDSATLRQTWMMALVVTVLLNDFSISNSAMVASKCKGVSTRLVNECVKFLSLSATVPASRT